MLWLFHFTELLTESTVFLHQKPIGGIAVLPSGGLFGKKDKKGEKDKENIDVNAPEQNGIDTESQLNSSADSDKSMKKERSKVRYFI